MPHHRKHITRRRYFISFEDWVSFIGGGVCRDTDAVYCALSEAPLRHLLFDDALPIEKVEECEGVTKGRKN
jgi:hypothetical protein